MSNNILKAIFKGDYLPWEPKYVKIPKLKELNNKIQTEIDYFEMDMKKEDIKRFDELMCLVVERDNVEMDALNFDNFMLGITVGLEIMEHKQRILED